MKQKWIRYDGKFECRSCIAIAEYILYKTGIKPEVHKTDTYLVINYVKDGLLKSEKIRIPAGVLYCLDEEDFADLFLKIGVTPKLY